MAALPPRAAFCMLLSILSVINNVYSAEMRYGSSGKYLHIERTKREPMVIQQSDVSLGAQGHLFEGANVPASKVLPDTLTVPLRRKRDAHDHTDSADASKTPEVTAFKLNDSHQLVMIDWAGEGSDVVICVSRDTQQTNTSASNILISYDYGSTFINKANLFKTKSGKPAIINRFVKNDKFTSRLVFTDLKNKYVYTTMDSGKNIKAHKLAFTPSELSHHPIDPSILLAYDTEDKTRKLWVTYDYGENWSTLALYVKSYYWSDSTMPPTLYVEREEPSGMASVIMSRNLFRDELENKVVITDIEEFEVKDEFLFAIKKVRLLGSKDAEPRLQLWISYRQGPFMNAEFPNDLPHMHYYVADISEGQVMVCVAHDNTKSNLYVSSVPRSSSHQVRFSLSLENIIYFNPLTNWENGWLSSVADKKFADLHPVAGIRGVFIASQLAANYTPTSTLGPEHLTSYITFDQGAIWKPIQPPISDAEGNNISCTRSSGCSLHLSQELSKLYPASQTVPILSKKSAPGLILATGTIGTSMKGHTGLYLSTDAGINWYQVKHGNYLYTIGDHGGIIMAVQMYQANGMTNVIEYSTDEGESWNTFQFYEEKLRVYGLMTEPGENTTIFTLFGSESEKHQWIFIKIDMKPVFKYACSEDDYKTWSPTDGRRGHKCLLGRKQVYERRIPHSNCYNGIDYDRPISVENCPCTRDDYECDFGFWKVSMESEECVKEADDAVDPYQVPLTCSPGRFYNRTKGYRNVPGDTCEGGKEYQYRPTITACPVTEEQEFLLVSTRQQIMRYDLVDPQAGFEPLPVPGLKMVIALDFDMSNNSVYWSDVDEKTIKRLCFDGHHDVEVLVDTNIQSVEGLALDWISKNLYFVDGERKTLEVIRTDISHSGRMRRTLLDSTVLDNPRGLAVHPSQGFLYITDWSEQNPMVARSLLDGTNLTVLFGKDVVGWPNGITIDFQTHRIYFADAKKDFIASADLEGKDMRKIISDSNKVMQPFALGIYKNLMFWDDWTVHMVLQADKEYGWGITPIVNYTKKGLVDLKVFGHWSQQGTNICGNSSASTCTHLCMARPNNGYSCLCPDGMKPLKNGTTERCLCPDDSEMLPDGTCNSKNNTCAPNFFRCDSGRCIPSQWVCDDDNDCGDNSDESEEKCGMKPCEAPAWQCKNGHCIAPSWKCDYDNDCGDNSDEVDCHYNDCPKDTFTCANGRCIHRTWMCDREDDCKDGSDERNCSSASEHNKCRGMDFTCPNGQCILGSWRCDGDKDCEDGADESNCTNVTCEPWQFQCNSKQCIFKTWRCDGEIDCQDGSDEENCADITTTTPQPLIPLGPLEPPTNLNCTALMFRCKNTHCIPFWWRCDGLDDCQDGSDEESCPGPGIHVNITTVAPTTKAPSSCTLDQFMCYDGSCIWDSWVCDHDDDCPGGEDEHNCHQMASCDDLKEFACRYSGGCIPSGRLCDGHPDCSDRSDEEGCSTILPDVSSCPSGFFYCDGGACIESFKQCDGNHNCEDLSDEQHCSSDDRAYFVTEFTVTSITNVSVAVKWEVNDNATNPENVEYMPSLIVKAMTGNPSAWKNFTWSSNSDISIKDLIPYTEYLLKVYIRVKNQTKIFPPIKPLVFRTEIGIPGPPKSVALQQENDIVKVSWKIPDNPNGPIDEYIVFFSPPSPPRQTSVSDGATELTIPASFLESPCTIWVTALNMIYASNASVSVNYTSKIIDSKVNVKEHSNLNSSVVHLVWDPIPGADSYMVSHSRPENVYQTGEVVANTSATEININGLAPGMSYIFSIRAIKGDTLSQATSFKVETPGVKLSAVKELFGEVMKNSATSVRLKWTKPAYSEQKQTKFEYCIVWGKTHNDLKHSANSAKTMNTSYLIQGLDACEEYLIAVMICGPIGIGPENMKRITTGPDFLAPPKNLQVKRLDPSNSTLRITWEPSCPLTRNDSLQYELLITDVIKNQSSYFQIPSKKKTLQNHEVELHYGGRYSVSVRNALSESRYSDPALCSGPMIPIPIDLTFNPSDETFFWKRGPNIPHELLKQNLSYILYVSQHDNMSDAITYPCDAPPLTITDLSPGIIYYVTVALKDNEGYTSPQSRAIRIERPIGSEIVMSQNSVVGVAVSVILVVIALVAVVGILAVRHRRLARSFLTFANTHYDRSQGTTLITTDNNLDEDDDSPMIRGFSDDEPMVIA